MLYPLSYKSSAHNGLRSHYLRLIRTARYQLRYASKFRTRELNPAQSRERRLYYRYTSAEVFHPSPESEGIGGGGIRTREALRTQS